MKRTKPEKKAVVVKAWCVVDKEGVLQYADNKYDVYRKRSCAKAARWTTSESVRRCRVIVE